MIQFFQYYFIPNGNPWYTGAIWGNLFASAICSVGVLYTLYRRYKCSKCWRLAYFKVKGTHYRTCHKHTTKHDHDILKANHKKKYPEQHNFLKESHD